MCITGSKKTAQILESNYQYLELDELYWFVERKPRTETRENVYLMTMVSREPRQIVGFRVAKDKSSKHIQAMVDTAPEAKTYCTDGYVGYVDVIYPGRHVRNMRNKDDTFTVEGVNADLRHYIPILARRSRCFARKIETLQAVLEVFVGAYNRFGAAKYKYRQNRISREVPFSVLDFL
jgi:IS1 family transposase